MDNVVTCPGCGLQIPSSDNIIIEEENASKACLNLYYQLAYYTLSLQDKEFIHQYIVDTYAAQHATKTTKPIKTAFAVIGIYLAIVHAYTGKQVQDMHIALANKTKDWPTFNIPDQKATLTILDVIKNNNVDKKNDILRWTQSVWDIWRIEEKSISATINKFVKV